MCVTRGRQTELTPPMGAVTPSPRATELWLLSIIPRRPCPLFRIPCLCRVRPPRRRRLHIRLPLGIWDAPEKIIWPNVKVTPLPAVTPPANRQHCSGTEAPAEPLTGTHGANSFKWSGGRLAGLGPPKEEGAGRPGYTGPAATEPIGPLQVTLLAKNSYGCESPPASFTISAGPKPSIVLNSSRPLCSGPTLETAAAAKIGIASNVPGVKYAWRAVAADNPAGGNSDVKIAKADGLATFPAEENTAQGGDFIKKITASEGSNALITFYIKPVLMGCEGEAASSEVRVRGITLQGGIANNAPSICSGSAVNITVGTDGDGLTYDWTSKDNVGNIQSLGTAQTASKAAVIRDVLTLKDNKRGNVAYIVTPSNGECTGALVPYSVFVNPVPVLTASPALGRICSGAKTAIDLSVGLSAPESNGVTYAWQASENSVGAFSSAGNRAAFEQQTLTNRSGANADVTYSFTASYNPGGAASPNCVSRPAAVRYDVSAPATASLGNVPEKICVGDVITLTAFPQGLVYQWSKDGMPIDGAVNSSFLVPTGPASVSSYTVSITNSCGNSTSDPKIVNVSADAYFAGAGITAGKSEGSGLLINFS